MSLATSAQRAVIAFSPLSILHSSLWIDRLFTSVHPTPSTRHELQRPRAWRGLTAPPPQRCTGCVQPCSPHGVVPLPKAVFAERGTDEDRAFTTLKDTVSIQIFKIQSNVQGIQKLVDKLGGGLDGPALRTSLYVGLGSCLLREASRGMGEERGGKTQVKERLGRRRGPTLWIGWFEGVAGGSQVVEKHRAGMRTNLANAQSRSPADFR